MSLWKIYLILCRNKIPFILALKTLAAQTYNINKPATTLHQYSREHGNVRKSE